MFDYSVKNIDTIATPQLLYYPELIRNNIELAVKIAGSASRIRSHVKSHKTTDIPKLQREYGINKFKCATIAEAEMLAMEGFIDVFLAYPLVAINIDRFIQLNQKYPNTKFLGLTDNLVCADEISKKAQKMNTTLNMMLDIDSGMHRTGVPFNKAAELYLYMSKLPNINMHGLHVYDGQNKQSDYTVRMAEATKVYNNTMKLKEEILASGGVIHNITMGGTPTFVCYAQFPEVDLSPGTCFLQDIRYQQGMPDLKFIPAACVATRVVNTTEEGVITFDMGHKAVAADPVAGDRGTVLGDLKLEHILQSEEHISYKVVSGDIPKIGDVYYVIPTHVCPTSALYEEIAIVNNAEVTEWWQVKARKRKITV